jgi:hypothetical protein
MFSKKIDIIVAVFLLCCSISTVFAQSMFQIGLTAQGSSTNSSNLPSNYTSIGVLHTEDTRIMKEGVEYLLYGMDVDRLPRIRTSSASDASTPYDTLFTPEDLDFFKQNGFNLVTLHLINLDEMTDGNGNIKENFFDNWVDVWVEWCTERELYCIIGMADFHVSSDSYGVYTMPSWVADGYGGKPSGDDWREEMREIVHGFYGGDIRSQNDREVYYDLWKYVANRYKDNPFVMYGPTNEPMHHTFQGFHPDESYWDNLAVEYSNTMTSVIDHIREGEIDGYEKLVFIDRPYLDNGEFMDYVRQIDRDNIVWEYHDYGGLSEQNKISNWKNSVKEQRDFFHNWSKPVHVGEWSVANTIDEFLLLNDAYPGGWKFFHYEQNEWMNQLDVSHSWFHYCQTAGEYWNIVGARNGEHVLSQSDTDYIFETLKERVRPQKVGIFEIIVESENGSPIQGAIASLSKPSEQFNLTGSTDWDGTVVFSGIIVGNYSLELTKSSYDTLTSEIIVENSTISQIYQMQKQKSGVIITIVDTNNIALSDVNITSISHPSGQEKLSSITYNGEISFSSIQSGNYLFEATLKGYSNTSKKVTLEPGEERNLTIVLEKISDTVDGTDEDENNEGILRRPYITVLAAAVLVISILWTQYRGDKKPGPIVL